MMCLTADLDKDLFKNRADFTSFYTIYLTYKPETYKFIIPQYYSNNTTKLHIMYIVWSFTYLYVIAK